MRTAAATLCVFLLIALTVTPTDASPTDSVLLKDGIHVECPPWDCHEHIGQGRYRISAPCCFMPTSLVLVQIQEGEILAGPQGADIPSYVSTAKFRIFTGGMDYQIESLNLLIRPSTDATDAAVEVGAYLDWEEPLVVVHQKTGFSELEHLRNPEFYRMLLEGERVGVLENGWVYYTQDATGQEAYHQPKSGCSQISHQNDTGMPTILVVLLMLLLGRLRARRRKV